MVCANVSDCDNHNVAPGLAEAAGEAGGCGEAEAVAITVLCGSFDAWVERDVLPGLESGALSEDFIGVVASLRAWEHDGTWNAAHAR